MNVRWLPVALLLVSALGCSSADESDPAASGEALSGGDSPDGSVCDPAPDGGTAPPSDDLPVTRVLPNKTSFTLHRRRSKRCGTFAYEFTYTFSEPPTSSVDASAPSTITLEMHSWDPKQIKARPNVTELMAKLFAGNPLSRATAADTCLNDGVSLNVSTAAERLLTKKISSDTANRSFASLLDCFKP